MCRNRTNSHANIFAFLIFHTWSEQCMFPNGKSIKSDANEEIQSDQINETYSFISVAHINWHSTCSADVALLCLIFLHFEHCSVGHMLCSVQMTINNNNIKFYTISSSIFLLSKMNAMRSVNYFIFIYIFLKCSLCDAITIYGRGLFV